MTEPPRAFGRGPSTGSASAMSDSATSHSIDRANRAVKRATARSAGGGLRCGVKQKGLWGVVHGDVTRFG